MSAVGYGALVVATPVLNAHSCCDIVHVIARHE